MPAVDKRPSHTQHRLAIITFAGVMTLSLGLWYSLTRGSYSDARRQFVASAVARHDGARERLRQTMGQTYEALRTISLLPGVQDINRYGDDFLGDARATVQQIFNNLVTHVHVSEIYIVPIDFDPEKVDPITGRTQEPICKFDETVIGRYDTTRPRSRAPAKDSGSDDETFEYREVKTQNAYFRRVFPSQSAIVGLNLPASLSDEIVTCDVSEFTEQDRATGDDSARRGFVYSVPFFRSNGRLAGAVCAVIRARVLERTLGDATLMLRRADGKTAVESLGLRARLGGAVDDLRAGRRAEALEYYKSERLDLVDTTPWELVSAIPASEWDDFPARVAAEAQSRFMLIGCVVTSLLCGVVVWILSNGRARAMALAEKMTTTLHESEIDLRRLNHELRFAMDTAESACLAKSDFLAKMSHEIRTPMNGIMGMTDLLSASPLNEQQQRFTHVIKRSAESLLSIINDILDFSKIEAGKLELENIEFDLRTTVEDAVELLAHKANCKRLSLACHTDPTIPRILIGDPSRLRQILVNLLNNAIKFTDTGSVVLRVRREDGPANPGQEFVRFSVIDTGIGIAPDRMERLFRNFSQVDASTTRKYGGTGLGLCIARQLAEMMGGPMGVESAPGMGSTFWFNARFEISASALLPVPREDRLLPDPRSLRVLVVDRDLAFRQVMVEQLASWGLDATTAGDGQEALRLIQSGPRGGGAFGVVILDVGLTDISVDEIAMKVNADAATRSTTLMILTQMSASSDVSAARRRGFAGVVTKPVRQSSLFDTIMDAIAVTQNGRTPVAGVEPAPKPSSARQPTTPGVRVLVAEDNEVNQMVVRHILRNAGYTCDIVDNGNEAVSAALKNEYDVVLMDCQMPELDGFDAARTIRQAERETGRHVPIFALTANAIKGDRERCLEAGMDDYLSKPIDSKRLVRMIERQVESTRVHTVTAPPAVASDAGAVAGHETRSPADLTPTGPDPIDLAALGSRCMNDTGIVDELLETFATQIPNDADALTAAVASTDRDRVASLAHRLKGGAATMSADRLARLALELEQLSKTDSASLESAMTELRQEMARCVEFARQRPSRPAPVG